MVAKTIDAWIGIRYVVGVLILGWVAWQMNTVMRALIYFPQVLFTANAYFAIFMVSLAITRRPVDTTPILQLVV